MKKINLKKLACFTLVFLFCFTFGLTVRAVPYESIGQADLMLTMECDNNNPSVNTKVNYTLRVFNKGPDTAEAVYVEDEISMGYEYDSSTEDGKYDAEKRLLTWQLGDLKKGEEKILRVTLNVNVLGKEGQYKNEAVVDSKTYEKNFKDNIKSMEINPVQIPVLTIYEEPSVSFTGVGKSIGYTIIVSNKSTFPLHNVIVTDPKIGFTPTKIDVLKEGESRTFKWNYTAKEEDIKSDIVNTAYAVSDEAAEVSHTSRVKVFKTLLAQTGDNFPILPFVVGFSAEIIGLYYLLSRRGSVEK